ncbi:iron chelate uptake ABC transporter family permease subunit [Polaribacter sargassicola]|uniref:iron chelate uptake ABC transporter family permease subunit n=1 Tax=Polaribacter sargassicola TaxID=2836891 RepID=UPI001F02275C|nr:iron chelate uptake ABC transporter family permease subunit [Polaribacter sp. DS7-9]MCG1035313.1 iron chelate uptake ABC transporter family permease subunit [Polaribacter sp. DS7-9]
MKIHIKKIILLVLVAIALCALFLSYDLPSNWGYSFERRSYKVLAIIIVSCSVGYASIVFQTLTHNRILTPSIMGFEAVYLLFQTIIVFLYGDKTFTVINDKENFFLSIIFMLGFAFILFKFIFKKEKNNLYLLLLIGLVLGTLFHTITSFLQLIIDPNDFLILQGSIYASFNKINYHLLWYALTVIIICFAVGFRQFKYLDVISLGKEHAINLGINYFKKVRFYLFIIGALVAVSTALVGPIIFLGILVTNLTYEIFKSYKHAILIPACCLICIISIVGAQFLVEHVFSFNIVISIIINFIGGLYFMYLLLKTKKV